MIGSSVKSVLRQLVRQPIFAAVAGYMLARKAKLLHDSARPDALTILAFSHARWGQDLAALAATGNVRVFAVDQGLLGRINGLFDANARTRSLEHFLETDSAELQRRQQHQRFAARALSVVGRVLGIDCAMSCAVHFVGEIPWVAGAKQAGFPFVTVHKEFTVIDSRHIPDRVETWRKRGFKFIGDRLCLTNKTAEELFTESEVVAREKVTVTGLLRADNLLGTSPRYRCNPDKLRPIVTLFSFGHLTGSFDLPLDEHRSHYFSKWDHAGFVDLFRETHVAFAELAIAHPDVEFKIKPKNVVGWWIEEIENAIKTGLGRSLVDIPNCTIVRTPAPELIEKSTAVIALNSTVVLESCVLGANTILPLFAEAAGKYSDRIYFDRYLDLFAVARSKDDLRTLVERALAGERIVPDDPGRRQQLCIEYFGNSDGEAATRVIEVIRNTVAEYDSVRAAAASKGKVPVGGTVVRREA